MTVKKQTHRTTGGPGGGGIGSRATAKVTTYHRWLSGAEDLGCGS